jgi:serine/threonine protein kinase
VKSFGWYDDAESVFIAMEYYPHGDLAHHLFNQRSLPPVEVELLTYQILEGLHQMHKNGFTHRDLKPGVGILFYV